MKISIAPRADDDIARQFRYYLLQDAPLAALRFRRAVRESLNQLTRHPLIGVSVVCRISGLRSWPVEGFTSIRIYYVLEGPGLRIVRILSSRQDVRRILNREVKLG